MQKPEKTTVLPHTCKDSKDKISTCLASAFDTTFKAKSWTCTSQKRCFQCWDITACRLPWCDACLLEGLWPAISCFCWCYVMFWQTWMIQNFEKIMKFLLQSPSSRLGQVVCGSLTLSKQFYNPLPGLDCQVFLIAETFNVFCVTKIVS